MKLPAKSFTLKVTLNWQHEAFGTKETMTVNFKSDSLTDGEAWGFVKVVVNRLMFYMKKRIIGAYKLKDYNVELIEDIDEKSTTKETIKDFECCEGFPLVAETSNEDVAYFRCSNCDQLWKVEPVGEEDKKENN